MVALTLFRFLIRVVIGLKIKSYNKFNLKRIFCLKAFMYKCKIRDICFTGSLMLEPYNYNYK